MRILNPVAEATMKIESSARPGTTLAVMVSPARSVTPVAENDEPVAVPPRRHCRWWDLSAPPAGLNRFDDALGARDLARAPPGRRPAPPAAPAGAGAGSGAPRRERDQQVVLEAHEEARLARDRPGGRRGRGAAGRRAGSRGGWCRSRRGRPARTTRLAAGLVRRRPAGCRCRGRPCWWRS